MAISKFCIVGTLPWIYLMVNVLNAQNCEDVIYKDVSYKFCTKSTARGIAQNSCASFNMKLAIIYDQVEFNYWQDFLRKDYPKNEVWVGATYDATRDGFFWDFDLGDVPDSFFGTYPDTGSLSHGICVRIYIDQFFLPLDCGQLRGYLCQEGDSVTVESKITTEVVTTESIIPSTEKVTTEGPTTEQMTTQDPTTHQATTEEATTEHETTADSSTASFPNGDTTESITDSRMATTEKISTELTISDSSSGASEDTTESAIVQVTSQVYTVNTEANSNLTDCECSCKLADIPTDKDELEEYVENEVKKIEQALFVDKKSLSSTIRKKTSAKDDRPSAKNVGYMGVVMLSLAGLIIVAMDLTYLGRLIETVLEKLKRKDA